METEQVPVQIHGEATPQAKRKRTSWQHMLGATERPRDCSSFPASDSSPVSLEPRPRPAAGVMAVHGPCAPHTRLCARLVQLEELWQTPDCDGCHERRLFNQRIRMVWFVQGCQGAKGFYRERDRQRRSSSQRGGNRLLEPCADAVSREEIRSPLQARLGSPRELNAHMGHS